MADERTPLLQRQGYADSRDPHDQFCALVGVPPSNLPPGAKSSPARPTSLYKRATRQRRSQNVTYMITASLSNTLLLTQVVLGATLTALGASESSHILITVFGVINTVIAGLVAYLKSRGQPMRARMYRDDLERVVDEIENSEVMWLGISQGVLGYDEIDPDEVTVRSEVARLTRLYDRAVKTNTMNNPDMYMAGGGLDGAQTGLRSRPLPSQPTLPVNVPDPTAVAPATDAPAAVAAPVAAAGPAPDPDESPATKAIPPPKEKSAEAPKDDKKPTSGEAAPSPDANTANTADHIESSRDGAPETHDQQSNNA